MPGGAGSRGARPGRHHAGRLHSWDHSHVVRSVVVRLDPAKLDSADIAALVTLAESFRLEIGVDDTPITFESEGQAWHSPLPSGARLARTEAGAVGQGETIFMDRDGEYLAEIGTLYVLPEFRRAGSDGDMVIPARPGGMRYAVTPTRRAGYWTVSAAFDHAYPPSTPTGVERPAARRWRPRASTFTVVTRRSLYERDGCRTRCSPVPTTRCAGDEPG